MKILIFGTVAGAGGIQRNVLWLAKTLAEAECEVLILSTGSPQATKLNQFNFNPKVRIKFFELTDTKLTVPFLVKVSQFDRLVRLANDFKPDVYLGLGAGWNLNLLPFVLPKRVRSIFNEVMSGKPSGWSDSRWIGRLWFDEIVAVSETVAKTYAKQFGWHKPIRAIPGLTEPLEMSASLPTPPSTTVEPGKVKAAFFGRLSRAKQSFWLVQQWDLLKDTLSELHIHGTGEDEQLIRDYIALHELGERVKCFGAYPSEGQDYADLLSSYDLMLLPTISDEGAPLVLMESMACGVPFVAYATGGIADYAVDNPNVLVVPSNLDAFVAGVREITFKLIHGQINRSQLQQFYLERYSYQVLKKSWVSYLGVQP